MNNRELEQKARSATGPLIEEKGYISFVDLFIGLGYLDSKDYEAWRRRQIPYLERAINVNLKKISLIMKAVRKNCLNGKLKPSRTVYKSWGKGKKIDLRFSKSGLSNIEELYSTHFVLPKKRDGSPSGPEGPKTQR